MATLAADRNFWDPLMNIFDFSLTFEEIILQLVPSGLSIALLPIFANRFRQNPVLVRSSPLLWAKLIISAALIVCHAASVGLHKHAISDATGTAIPAASLELVAALNVGVMIYVGHRHAIHSSSLLALYLLVTFLIDIVKSRSFFLRSGLAALGSLAAATASLRFCLLGLEELSKRNQIIDDDIRKISGPESTSGYFTRAFFLFLNPMFIAGFSHSLRQEDMGKLGLDFSSSLVHQRLKTQWERKEVSTSQSRLIFACFRAWKWDILLMLIPRFMNIGLNFAQPFLIEKVINTAELDNMRQGDMVSTGQRAGMQAATFAIFVSIAVAKAATTHLSNRLSTQVRGALIAQLMQKTHHLSDIDAKKSAVLTHMSSDIEDIATGLATFIDIPITLIETGIGVFFLSRFIGSSCFFVLLPVLSSNLCAILLSRAAGPELARWNKSIELRIAKTTEILKQLPGIKMLGLGPTMRNQIHKLRIWEMEQSRRYRFVMAFVNMTQQFADLGTPVVVIAAAFFWKGFDGKMSSTQVFPTLAVVNLIQGPTVRALDAYAFFTSMTACFGRIQSFLLLPERKDSRVKWDPSANPQSYEPVPTHYGSVVMRPRLRTHSPGGIIQFSSASFGPVEMDTPLLSDVNFALFRGSVTGVIGGTGSGKTTFFQSILGETKIHGGCIYTDKVNIAYCGSNVWLRDVSIRENVVGGLVFDPVRYEIAIRVCQLEEDLARLPGSDEYVVGPNGFNLSGGQRQRVALARGVFARCDITIIDDGFSALDGQTATTILYALCGQDGVLRRAGSTVLIATYMSEITDVIDKVITLDEEGQILLSTVEHLNPSSIQWISQYLSSVTPSAPVDLEDKEKATIRRSWNLDAQQPSEPKEDCSKRTGSWHFYMLFIESIGKLRFVYFVVLASVLSSFEAVSEVYVRIWTENGPDDGRWFIGYSLIAGTACAFTAVVYWLLYTVFAVRSGVALHEQILEVTMRATLGFLTSTKTGNLLNRFSQDSNLFAKILPGKFFRTIYIFGNVLWLVGIILSSATYMSATLPAIVIAIYLIQDFYLRTSRQLRHKDLEEKAPLYTYFCETADGLTYLHSFGWLEKSMANGYRLLDTSQQPYYLMLCIQQWLVLVIGLLSAAVAFVLVSIVVWVRNGTSGPAVGLSLLSILSFSRSLVDLLQSWTATETAVAGLARLYQFKTETPLEPRPSPQAPVALDWPSAGNVDFTGVSARYKPADDVPPIIRDLSLAIDPSDKVGIVGRTGSGKSSLLLTLLGFLQYEGTIEIDGVDLRSIDPDFLRSRVITITQDPVQFNDTIRKNLLPFTINSKESNNDDKEGDGGEKLRQDNAKDAMLMHVLGRLNLWDALPRLGGLDAMLQDVGYSKGEIQLFSIARAIVRYRETGINLVLVDEATSNLDPRRDEAVQKIMQEEFDGCTIITVAHRQETIQNVDFTVEMNAGMMTNISVPQQAPTLFTGWTPGWGPAP